MSTTAKRQIIQGLDDLPEQSLVAVAEFVDFLRAKAVAGPTALCAARVVKLGGLWKGHLTGKAGRMLVLLRILIDAISDSQMTQPTPGSSRRWHGACAADKADFVHRPAKRSTPCMKSQRCEIKKVA